MPKNKTHKGTSKRVKVTGTGKLVSEKTGKRHRLEVKSSKETRAMAGTVVVSPADAPRLKKLLGL
jgi:large subunit ribosomal protein L35